MASRCERSRGSIVYLATPCASTCGATKWSPDTSDGSYQPGFHVTRAQMAVFVARAIVDPTGDECLAGYTPPAAPSFTDVPTTYWCFVHIEYLVGAGVVSGYDDGFYRPTAAVTRDQMAVYVARAFGLLSE